MQIDSVEVRHIRMQLTAPFETSFGVESDREALIVAVRVGELVGYGEVVASAAPLYSYETVQTAGHILRDFLVPDLLRRPFEHPAELDGRWAFIRGHNMAKAGAEAACWDVWARAQGISMAQALGGVKAEALVGISLGIQPSIEATLERVAAAVERGYGRVKLKIKPGWDVEMVGAVREAFPTLALMADANSAYTLDDAPLLKKLDAFGLTMVEQPLAYDDIFDHRKLQAQLATPICLDESIHSPAHAAAAIELGSCRIINIKPGRVGGLEASRRIHDICAEHGVPVWCGGMLETGIGRAHNVALASLPNFTLHSDISESARYYHQDLVEPEFVLGGNSTLAVPNGPGIGVAVLAERLDAVTLASQRVGR
jgi:o-succinylbenzoate synthase